MSRCPCGSSNEFASIARVSKLRAQLVGFFGGAPMPISPTYPGVYVQEVPSGVRTITGVSTSIGLFVGFTRSGPVDTPTLCTSLSDYTRVYGDDTTAGDMARQVKLFFLNGGTQCYICLLYTS